MKKLEILMDKAKGQLEARAEVEIIEAMAEGRTSVYFPKQFRILTDLFEPAGFTVNKDTVNSQNNDIFRVSWPSLVL